MANKILKSCPFCGEEAEIVQIGSGHSCGGFYVNYSVECCECGIGIKDGSRFIVEDGVPIVERDGYSELIKRWNKRAGEK